MAERESERQTDREKIGRDRNRGDTERESNRRGGGGGGTQICRL